MPTAKALLPTDQIQRSAQVLSSEVNGELVLFDPVGAVYVGLDAIGTEVWGRLESRKRMDEVVQEICGHFDGEPALIAREATAFIENLWERGLVQAEG